MLSFGLPAIPALLSLPVFGFGKKKKSQKHMSARAVAAAEAALAQFSMGPPCGLSPVTYPQPKPQKTRGTKEKKPCRPSPYKKWSWPFASVWCKEQQHLQDWQEFNVNYAALHSVNGEPETYENQEGWMEVDWNDHAWLEKSLMKFDIGTMSRYMMGAGVHVGDEPQDYDEDPMETMYDLTGAGGQRGLSVQCGRWS